MVCLSVCLVSSCQFEEEPLIDEIDGSFNHPVGVAKELRDETIHDAGSDFGPAQVDVNDLDEGARTSDAARAKGKDQEKGESKPGCQLSDEPARVTTALLKSDWEGKNSVKLLVSNVYSEEAEVSLIVTIFSSRQFDTVKLDPVKVPAEGKAEIEVDLQELGISSEALDVTGDLYMGSESHFADGSEERGSGPPLHFHPSGKDIEAYSPAARLKRADKGHLSQAAKDQAEALKGVDELELEPGEPALLSSFFEGETPGEDSQPRSIRAKPRHVLPPENVREPEAAARAMVNVKFCFKVVTDYLDAHAGEDYWTNANPLARGALGQWVKFGNLGWSYLEYNGSNRGCWTPPTAIPTGDYLITMSSKGSVNGWIIAAGELPPRGTVYQSYALQVTSSGTKWITVGYNDVQNSYMATAKALRTHGGRSAYKGTVDLRVGDCDVTAYKVLGPSRWTDICSQPDKPADHLNKKFTIAHEIGHMLQDYNFNLFPQDYSLNPPGGGDCDPLGDGELHYTTSTEKQSTAANEGFANFYAADAFNDHSVSEGDSCWMKIGSKGPQGGRFSCTGGWGSVHPLKLMESRCAWYGGSWTGPPTGLEGYGNETDWTRAFWEIHVYSSGTTSFNTLLDWMELAENGMNWRDAYERLYDTAPLIDPLLRQKWIDVATTNGIDWVQ